MGAVMCLVPAEPTQQMSIDLGNQGVLVQMEGTGKLMRVYSGGSEERIKFS